MYARCRARTKTPAEVGRGRLVKVALPAEHGGWSLTLEPVLLGVLVAPSTAGFALGAAALLAFLARTPLKLALVDRRRGRWMARSALAARVASLEVMMLVGAATIAVLATDHAFWWPLAVAAPLIAVELSYDIRSHGRRFIPELAGAVAMGSVAGAVALAGGASDGEALALWLALAARSVAAIPFVRVQLRRAKHQANRISLSDLAHVVAMGIAVLAWQVGELPGAAVVAIGILVLVESIALRRPPPKAAIIGAEQVILGLLVVLTTGFSMIAA